MIVTEYMNLGALDGFLRVSGVGPGGGNDLVTFGPLLFSSSGLGVSIVPREGAPRPGRPAGSQGRPKPGEGGVAFLGQPPGEPPCSPGPRLPLSLSGSRARWRPGSCWGCCLGWRRP